jgi:oligopeptide/dipeptide ABC transporter ATP-binding protein
MDATIVEALSAQVTGNVVEVEGLRVRIRTGRGLITVVDGMSYSVGASETLALVGESGAGKSISVRAVLGLLDPRKFDVSGSIRLNGVELASLTARQRRRHVARCASLVFQDPTRSLNPTMRIGWQIAEAMYKSPAREHKLTKGEAREQALQLMRDVGIAAPEERFFAYPHQLSGGMRQRVVIAIALSCVPSVIFCDEPTTSLDVTTQAQIMDLLADLQRRLSIAVVLITHDLALAAEQAREIMVMYAGKIVEHLPSRDIVTDARMPYTRALLDSVPDTASGAAIPVPIAGTPPDPRALPPGCAFAPRCGYAQEICSDTIPELRDIGTGHLVRCFFPVTSAKEATR